MFVDGKRNSKLHQPMQCITSSTRDSRKQLQGNSTHHQVHPLISCTHLPSLHRPTPCKVCAWFWWDRRGKNIGEDVPWWRPQGPKCYYCYTFYSEADTKVSFASPEWPPHCTDWNGNSPLSDFRSCSHGPVQASSVQTTGNSGKLHVSPGAECTTATESAHSLMRVQLCKQRMVQTCDQRPFHLRVLKNACYWLWHFPSTPTYTPTSTYQPATFDVTNRNKVKCYILFTHLDPWWGLEMTSSHTTGNSKFPLLLIRKLASKHYWWWRWRRHRGWPRCCCCCWLRT